MNTGDAKTELIRSMYRIELRWGDKPWWICTGSRVVSKHTSKRAAQAALRHRIARIAS
jgi:hypothetical protein